MFCDYGVLGGANFFSFLLHLEINAHIKDKGVFFNDHNTNL